MTANELADAMDIRALIRRQATSRKSVQEGADDRLADQLEQAATMLRQQAKEIEELKNKAQHYEDRWRDALMDLNIERDFLGLWELSDEEMTQQEIQRLARYGNKSFSLLAYLLKKASEK